MKRRGFTGHYEFPRPDFYETRFVDSVRGNMQMSIILTSSPNHEASVKIAQGLTQKRLAACVSIIPGLRSFYWWEGKIQDEREELLFIKTARNLSEEACKEIKSLHPYDTPEIVTLEPSAVDEKYLSWLLSVSGDDHRAGQQ